MKDLKVLIAGGGGALRFVEGGDLFVELLQPLGLVLAHVVDKGGDVERAGLRRIQFGNHIVH